MRRVPAPVPPSRVPVRGPWYLRGRGSWAIYTPVRCVGVKLVLPIAVLFLATGGMNDLRATPPGHSYYPAPVAPSDPHLAPWERVGMGRGPLGREVDHFVRTLSEFNAGRHSVFYLTKLTAGEFDVSAPVDSGAVRQYVRTEGVSLSLHDGRVVDLTPQAVREGLSAMRRYYGDLLEGTSPGERAERTLGILNHLLHEAVDHARMAYEAGTNMSAHGVTGQMLLGALAAGTSKVRIPLPGGTDFRFDTLEQTTVVGRQREFPTAEEVLQAEFGELRTPLKFAYDREVRRHPAVYEDFTDYVQGGFLRGILGGYKCLVFHRLMIVEASRARSSDALVNEFFDLPDGTHSCARRYLGTQELLRELLVAAWRDRGPRTGDEEGSRAGTVLPIPWTELWYIKGTLAPDLHVEPVVPAPEVGTMDLTEASLEGVGGRVVPAASASSEVSEGYVVPGTGSYGLPGSSVPSSTGRVPAESPAPRSLATVEEYVIPGGSEPT